MVWNGIFILFILLTLLAYYYGVRICKFGYSIDRYWLAFVSTVILVILFIVSLIVTGNNQYAVSTYKRSGELVVLKEKQRNEQAALIQKELSAEQYRALMEATPNSDVLVILGTGASAVLLDRAHTLVALNSDLNNLVNQLTRDRIKLCSYADNTVMPRLFIGLECPAPINVVAPGT